MNGWVERREGGLFAFFICPRIMTTDHSRGGVHTQFKHLEENGWGDREGGREIGSAHLTPKQGSYSSFARQKIQSKAGWSLGRHKRWILFVDSFFLFLLSDIPGLLFTSTAYYFASNT
ncbi:hypothetical protein LZ31DRAFT_203282 [Colletotrichum somersetense]|nr:hypothetical protein LZ31DRAFT_203282 [Colletotrichum somersetense]